MNYPQTGCCRTGNDQIEWHDPDSYTQTSGWLICGGTTNDGDASYIEVDYCPWCGKKLLPVVK